MKKILTILFLLISNWTFSQLKATVINGETRRNIPYVNIWVENENIGTTSNENGEFELDTESSKIIHFSAIGFETKKIISDSIENFLELKPLITELDEVFIKPKKLTQHLEIGTFNKSEINSYFACGTKPWISARFFNYKGKYNDTPFINKIRLLTKSNIKDSKFHIRIYSVNDLGEPEDYIYKQNIVGIAKKGKEITEIDISNLNIVFPKEGFFIGIEWLIIESNQYEFSYTMHDSKKKIKGISYEPAIGTIPSSTDENSWIFNQGKWQKIWGNKNGSSQEKYSLMAIELILTD